MRLDDADYAKNYAEMYDSELMQVARSYDSLTEVAQTAIRAEFARRGLEPPIVEEPEAPPVWDEMVTVGTYRDLTEAEVAHSALESAGIRAYVQDANVLRMNWGLSNALGGIRLQVGIDDQQSARELLAQSIPEKIDFAEDETFEQPRCPRCGSTQITFEGASRKLAIASLYVLSLPIPPGSKAWTCSSCGAKWEDTES